MKKHVLLAVAVVLLCVLLAGTVSAVTLSDGTLGSWETDRTEPNSWSITDGTISFNVAESPTSNFYEWHGKKSSVTNADFTNYWEVESTLTLPENPENVGVSLWIQVDGIPTTGTEPNREDQKSVMDWSIFGYYENEWRWFDSWAESDNWKSISVTIPEAEIYTLKTVYSDGTITQYVNNQQVNSYSLSDHFSEEKFIQTLTAPSVLYVNSKSYGTVYTTKWTVPTVKFSEGLDYDSTVGVSDFEKLKSNLESGKYVILGKEITGTEIPTSSYDNTRISISSNNPTLDLNGFTLSSSVNSGWDAKTNSVSFIKIIGGSLTVKDSQTNGKILLTGGTHSDLPNVGAGVIFLVNGGSFTIDSGSFEASYADINVQKGSTATINEGTFKAAYSNLDNFGTTTINGGTFTSENYGFTVLGDGTNSAVLSITDCDATANAFVVSGNGLCPKVDIDITGGKLTSTQAAAIYMPAAGTLDISGNTEISGSSGLEIRTGTVTISDTVQITATGEDQYAEDVSGNGSLDDGSTIVLHKKAGSYAGNIALTLSDSVKVTSEKGTAIRNYVRNNNINTDETVTVTINGDNVRIQGANAAIENAKYTSESEVESAFVGTFNLQNGYYSAPSQGKLLVEVYPTYADTNHVMSDTPVKDGYYAPIEIKKQESSATASDAGGTITITPTTGATTTQDPENEKVVTITPSGDNAVTLILTYTEAPAIDANGVVTSSNAPEKVVAGYKPVDVPESSGTVGTTFSLTVTTNGDSDLTLMQTDSLPTISTEINEDAKTKLQGAATLISMVTVDITKIKQKNPELTLAFKVPKSFFIGKDLSAVRAYHFDGTNIEEKGTPQRTEDGDNYVFTVTASTASPWMLGLKSSSPAPGPQPQPVYSSGDGNMENAFRVLFDTQGGSYVSPATGLSYGDKITAPTNPVRDGYTFGGWYKDAACTQGWSFSDAIDGDMTLYAKWTGGSAVQQTTTATAQPTTKQTTAPQQTQSQSQAAATTAVPAATTAAGVTPTLTQAPAPMFGALLGLLAAGVLLRRRE